MLGGPRHGEVTRLREGTQSFTDLVSGTTYFLRPFVWAPVSKVTQQPDKERALVRMALAHETVQTPDAGWNLLHDYLSKLWMQEGGRSLKEAAAEEIAAREAAGESFTPDAPAPGIILNGKATP